MIKYWNDRKCKWGNVHIYISLSMISAVKYNEPIGMHDDFEPWILILLLTQNGNYFQKMVWFWVDSRLVEPELNDWCIIIKWFLLVGGGWNWMNPIISSILQFDSHANIYLTYNFLWILLDLIILRANTILLAVTHMLIIDDKVINGPTCRFFFVTHIVALQRLALKSILLSHQNIVWYFAYR